MSSPDFFTAFYAAVCAVKDGEVDSIDVTHLEQDGDRMVQLQAVIRRAMFDTAEVEE